MKKTKAIFAITCAAMVLASTTSTVTTFASTTSYHNMYRLYNSTSGEHFYTASTDERNSLITIGWKYEGIAWESPDTSNTPVYRLYNPNSGDHFYTTSANERDTLVSLGWNDEGIGWYSDDNNEVAVYREYNPNVTVGTHNYTTDTNEDTTLGASGWSQEGISWYGVNGAALDAGTIPTKTSSITTNTGISGDSGIYVGTPMSPDAK